MRVENSCSNKFHLGLIYNTICKLIRSRWRICTVSEHLLIVYFISVIGHASLSISAMNDVEYISLVQIFFMVP
jgi:hypothetical protein